MWRVAGGGGGGGVIETAVWIAVAWEDIAEAQEKRTDKDLFWGKEVVRLGNSLITSEIWGDWVRLDEFLASMFASWKCL